MRVVRYLRVSRVEQNLDLQEDETMELVKRRGWTLLESFIDHGVSGVKERRPALDRRPRTSRSTGCRPSSCGRRTGCSGRFERW
jgi:hypothetical protein